MIKVSEVQEFLEWMKRKIKLHKNANAAKGRIVKRGQVYWCDLGKGIGSEEQKDRPCVIIQNNTGNKHSPNTIVVPITNSPGIPAVTTSVSGTYTYRDKEGNNTTLSGYILLSNMITVSKGRLGNIITTLTNEIDEIDDKILTSVGLYSKFKTLKDKAEKNTKFIKKLKQENRELNENVELNKEIKEILDKVRIELGVSEYNQIVEEVKRFKK